MKTVKDIITFLHGHLSDSEFEDLICNEWGLDGYFEDPPDVIEIIEYLKGSEITLVQPLEGKYFPFPEYGWDGGNAIHTSLFNIKVLTPYVDLLGGPMAAIGCKKDPNLPAFSFNKYEGEDTVSFLVFL